MSPAGIVVLALTLVTAALLVVIEIRSRRNAQLQPGFNKGESRSSLPPEPPR